MHGRDNYFFAAPLFAFSGGNWELQAANESAPPRQVPVALPAHEVRKTVTLVFSDLKGSTALGERLDPETLRDVMDRYFKAMSAEITRHGGKIEKFIGDAIMAVFGLPRAHEDDALRAVRAAAGMRTALGKVNVDLLQRYGIALANRTGVNTGEVVANDDPAAAQKLVTGDAVNVAARLEQAAGENEVLLGETTYRLVRDAVEVESVEPLELKGKSERVAAWRLVSAQGLMGSARRQDTPVVGRDAELLALSAAYREVCGSGSIRSRAAAIRRRIETGSSSPSSTETQAKGRTSRAAHCESSVVLP